MGIDSPVYHYVTRDVRYFSAIGQWTCAVAQNVTVYTTLQSGSAIRTGKTIKWTSKKTGTWTVTLDCDMSAATLGNIYMQQYTKLTPSHGPWPWLIGGSLQTAGYCDYYG
jgi:hypothetical protein